MIPRKKKSWTARRREVRRRNSPFYLSPAGNGKFRVVPRRATAASGNCGNSDTNCFCQCCNCCGEGCLCIDDTLYEVTIEWLGATSHEADCGIDICFDEYTDILELWLDGGKFLISRTPDESCCQCVLAYNPPLAGTNYPDPDFDIFERFVDLFNPWVSACMGEVSYSFPSFRFQTHGTGVVGNPNLCPDPPCMEGGCLFPFAEFVIDKSPGSPFPPLPYAISNWSKNSPYVAGDPGPLPGCPDPGHPDPSPFVYYWWDVTTLELISFSCQPFSMVYESELTEVFFPSDSLMADCVHECDWVHLYSCTHAAMSINLRFTIIPYVP